MESSYTDLVSKFKDGEERYRRSPLFHMVINKLARGANSLSIIDDLIIMNEGTQKEFENYVKVGPPPLIIMKGADT